ncbi:VOC family protein [Candidatus Woesearchaeota archaeon]|nr:VOC family protein [Candidatus Woesearchaeota archaeon]
MTDSKTQPETLDDLLPGVDVFLGKVFAALKRDGIGTHGHELDHVCYRVETLERYDELKAGLARLGELLSEVEIGGRYISTFRLKEPIVFGEGAQQREIYCVELPEPKQGSPRPEGWEHAEFAIGEDYDHIMRAHPELPWITKGAGKSINPDVALKYVEQGITVKFHRNPLEKVIKYEQGHLPTRQSSHANL